MPDFGKGAALVVGGSGGVGAAVARALAQRGSDVAITYRSNEGAANELSAELRALGRTCSTHAVDVRDATAAQACLAAAVETHGAVHTVVHAAGSPIPLPYVSQVTPDQWRDVMEADANGFFHVVRAAIPHLRESRGSLVAISSAGLRRFPPGDVLSIAPKGAIEALVRAVAREEGRFGVRANVVAPAVVEGGMFDELVKSGELTPQWIEAATRNTPLRRFARLDEVAAAVVFFASSQASYVTGQTLVVDGGYSL